METNNYPDWLVNVGQAKRLKKIGFDLPCQFFLPIKMYEDFDTRELGFDFEKENYNKDEFYWSIPSHEEVTGEYKSARDSLIYQLINEWKKMYERTLNKEIGQFL